MERVFQKKNWIIYGIAIIKLIKIITGNQIVLELAYRL